MSRYVIKRLLLIIPIIIGISFVIFTIMALTPGDPASLILSAGATQDDIDALNHELGYDRPFMVRYFSYIFDLVRGDMGKSYITRQPVLKQVLERAPVSLQVAFNTIVFSVCVGVPLGVLSAVKQYSLLDSVPTFVALLLASAPAFLIGMILMLIFALRLGWLPSSWALSGDTPIWKRYILPMLALGLPYAGRQLRFTRSSMLETIRQDYIRTARAKGAKEQTVIWNHAMRNALLPVITDIGTNFGGLLGGAVVVETLFSIPGIGTLIVNSIKQKDLPMVMGGTIALAVMFSIIMLIVDLIHAFVDPRVKAKYKRR